MIRLIS